MVSATDAQDVRLVQQDAEGNPIKLKYLPSAYFNDDIRRKVYFEGAEKLPLLNALFQVHWTFTFRRGLHCCIMRRAGCGRPFRTVIRKDNGSTFFYWSTFSQFWTPGEQPDMKPCLVLFLSYRILM